MKRSDELKQQVNALISECEALTSRCTAEGREFTATERDRFNSKMADCKKLQEDYAVAKETDDNTALMRASRVSLDTPTPVYNSNGTQAGGYNANTGFDWGSGPRVVLPTLTSFRSADRGQAARDAHDCGLWLKATIGGDGEARTKLEARRGTTWLATQNESSAVNGGYLVPAPLEAAVIVSRQEAGAMRKLARIVPMTSETLQFPKQTDGTTVYYPGEEGSITPSDLDFGRVGLVTKKRAIYSLFSNELRDDALVSVVDLLTQDMGNQFALKEDSEGILGDGGSTYGGVAGIKQKIAAATASIAQAATGHDTWPELDFSDFAAVMAKLPAKYRAGNNLAWLCSPSFKWAVMDRLAIGANGAMSQVWVDGQPQDRFLGYPVVLSDYCETATAVATVCAYFGNWQRAVFLGDRTQVRIATSEHIAFQTDQTAVRATVRYDIAVHEAGDTSNAGAIVGMKTAA